MKKTTKSKHTLRYFLLAILVLCMGVLCGFSLSNTGQEMTADAYGKVVNAAKANFTKQVTIGGENSGTLTYKETQNIKDAPANSRSDNYGTYDVYKNENGDEYIYLLNSDLLCGYKAHDATDIMDHTATVITQTDAKKAAAAYINSLFGNDAQKYQFESIETTPSNVFYIDYCFYLGGVKTDDKVTLWVRTTDGTVSAWHAFNRGRYADLARQKQNISLSANKSKLQKQLPIIESENYKIDEQYLTLSDDGTLVMHYKIYQVENNVVKPHEIDIPVE